MTISPTNTTEWEIQQLVKTNLFVDEQAVLRRALRVLFEQQPDMKRLMIVRSYVHGEISLGKAAQLMGLSHEAMKEVIIEMGEQVHLGPTTIDELLEDAQNG